MHPLFDADLDFVNGWSALCHSRNAVNPSLRIALVHGMAGLY